MSLVIATPDRIVTDCYFAAEGGPRTAFKKLVRLTSEHGTALFGFVGCAGCGELLSNLLMQMLLSHGSELIAALKSEWVFQVQPYASEEMESTTGIVVFRPVNSKQSTMLMLEGSGLVTSLDDMDFVSIGYTPATAFVAGYMFGKNKSSRTLHNAIKITAKHMDFVDASKTYEESFDG